MNKKNVFLFFFVSFCCIEKSTAQIIIPLYADSIPNSRPSNIREKSDTNRQTGIIVISKVVTPTLTAYLPSPEKATGCGVVICPGGGYWVLIGNHEGSDIAKKLSEMGIAAFVLKYRLPNSDIMENKEIGPLQDAQQAIKIIREHAKSWNLDPAKIGIMGFSAGGHLAATAGTHFSKALVPNKQNTSLRPDFMVLVYAEISFQENIGVKGAWEPLLGKSPSDDKLKEYSNELQVSSQTPPTFIIQAADDKSILPKQSIAFFEALLEKKVPVELHIYEKSGHGFGAHLLNTNEEWIDRCRNWLVMNKFITSHE
ncbi:MAG: alpha/beta hydrolase [Bacteroidota bacterium]